MAQSRVHFYQASSGDEIFLPGICMKVRPHSEVEWYFSHIAPLLICPQEFISFVVTDVAGDIHVIRYKRLISEGSHTLLTSLKKEADGTVCVAVKCDEAPTDYPTGSCVCDFGGCCRLCGSNVPRECCGTDGCCRSAECGHECCEKAAAEEARFERSVGSQFERSVRSVLKDQLKRRRS